MSVQLLDKTRKINKLLHNNNSHKVVFNDICKVLSEILLSNILVISKKGKVLGVSIWPGVDEIEELIEEYEVTEIVLGLPKNMNDTMGPRVEATLEFKEKLERRTGLPVHTFDERLTTVTADKTMMEAGVRREHRKEYVDMIAAVLILQEYLDRQRMQTENGQEN